MEVTPAITEAVKDPIEIPIFAKIEFRDEAKSTDCGYFAWAISKNIIWVVAP